MGFFDIILIIVIIAGNAFLFSGAIFGDLAGNSLAIYCVIFAIMADVFFAYMFINNERHENHPRRSENDLKEKTSTLKESNQPPEKVRKVNLIIKKYSSINTNAAGKAVPFHIDSDLINREVVSAVRSCKDSMAGVYQKIFIDVRRIRENYFMPRVRFN